MFDDEDLLGRSQNKSNSLILTRILIAVCEQQISDKYFVQPLR